MTYSVKQKIRFVSDQVGPDAKVGMLGKQPPLRYLVKCRYCPRPAHRGRVKAPEKWRVEAERADDVIAPWLTHLASERHAHYKALDLNPDAAK